MGTAQTQIHLFAVVADLGRAHGTLAGVVGEVAGAVLLLNQEGIAALLNMGCPDANFPLQLRRIGPQIHDGAALIHIHAHAHIGIAVPEELLVGAVDEVAPQRALRLGIGLFLAVVVGKLRHGHVDELALLFKLTIVGTAVVIAGLEQRIGRLPPAHLVHPAGADKLHVVGIAVVELGLIAILVDEVKEVGIALAGIGAVVVEVAGGVEHAPEHILRMGTEVGAVAIVAGHEIPAQMRDGHNAAVLLGVGRRGMGIDLGGNPGRPGAAVHEGVPGVIAGVVGLGAFLPAGSHSALDAGVLFLDVVGKGSVQIVTAGGFGIEAEALIELAKDIVHHAFLHVHIEHPDAEVLGLILFAELLAGKPQKRQADFIAVGLVIGLGQRHRLIVEQRSVGHLNGSLKAVFMGGSLLDFEDIQAFGEQRLAPQVLSLAMAGDLFSVLRHHFRPVDDVENKFFHVFVLSRRKILRDYPFTAPLVTPST